RTRRRACLPQRAGRERPRRPALGRRGLRGARIRLELRATPTRDRLEDCTMTSVLYDVPGPRAILRNRILAVLTVLLVLGGLAFVIYRFAATGQFTAEKWYVFSFGAVWVGIGQALGATLAAFGAAAVGS